MTTTNIKDYKTKKKAAKIVEDLTEVIKIIDLSVNGLGHYSKYINVMECISVLQTSRTLLEIHLNKFKKLKNNEQN